MYISVKNNFEASCYLTNPVSYDNSNYPKSFSYNLIDFFNDVTKINFPKFLSEMSENDFLTLFIGNLDGENIFSVNTKWILQTIEKKYFAGNQLSKSTTELISTFCPNYKMFCSLYRAVLLLVKNNILCVNNRKKGDSKYAELLLKNISQKKSICYTKYFPTVFMLIFDIYSDLQNKDKEIAETFYKKTNELLNKNLYPEFDLNGNLINNIIINPEIITFDEFINKYCSIENRCIDNNNDSVSNEIIDHLQFLYNFLTSPQLVHSIWDESFFDPESDDGINSKLISLQDFLSIDNNNIFTLDLVEYLYKCYEKYTDIQDFYYIDDDPTILAKIFLFSAAYLRLHPDDDKKSIPFRKCNICKHNYISIDISSKDNNHCYCFICRSNYNELINGYNTLFNNSIAPARSRMSFNNEKIKTKWSDIYEIIEKSKYYEIKKYLKDKILRLDKKVFSDEIKTELKFLEFPDEIGNHSLENLQYFYKNYLCKSPFEKLFDEASEKERNDFVYNAKLILNKNIKQDFFDLDKNT